MDLGRPLEKEEIELLRRLLAQSWIEEDGTVRIDLLGVETGLFASRRAPGTAIVIWSDQNSPCLKLIARGNAAALEIEQVDGEDAAITNGDLRCRAVVGEIAAMRHGLELFDRTDPESGKTFYAKALAGDGVGNVVVGGDWPHVTVSASRGIHLQIMGEIIATIDRDGLLLAPGKKIRRLK